VPQLKDGRTSSLALSLAHVEGEPRYDGRNAVYPFIVGLVWSHGGDEGGHSDDAGNDLQKLLFVLGDVLDHGRGYIMLLV